MVSITVQLNFDYALSFRFFLLWQPLVETGARSQIPIILVTAKAQSPDGDAFAGVDVVAVFPKPLRPLKLAEQINRVLV